jgi:uncharacterized protein involved in exopolysaccharide biosynthesis
VDTGPTLLDFIAFVRRHRRLLTFVPLGAGVLTALITLFLPNQYTATARLCPPQQNQLSAALLGSITGLNMMTGGGGGGLGSALGIKNPNDIYVGMLQSNRIADRLIDRYKLKERYKQSTRLETRKELDDATDIFAGKDGLIVIEVRDTDPAFAAELANAYVKELDDLTQDLSVGEASQRRLFFENELKTTREKLSAAEMGLKRSQEKTGLILPEGQSKAIFESFADLRARIAAKEVELAAMRTFATTSNRDYVRTKEALEGLRVELAKLERSKPAGHGDILVPTGKVAEAGLDYARRMRDVKYYEMLFELLARQFELAKIDEAKDSVVLQVVDHATPPDRKSGPKRAVITLLVTLFAALATLAWTHLRELLARQRP